MSNPLTTIVLHFAGSDEGVDYDCRYESDEVRNVDAAGEVVSSFAPGDPYYFLVYCVGNARVTRIVPTGGSVSSLGGVTRNRSDEIGFPELNLEEGKPTLSYRPTGGISVDWRTNIAPSLNVGSGVSVDSSDQSVTISGGTVPCHAKISYNVAFQSYLFTPPAMTLGPDESLDIYIYIYLEAT